MSPMARTFTAAAPTPSPGGSVVAPQVSVITTYVAVPTYVAAPPAGVDDSDVLNIVTTFGGLLASLVGLVSAVVSVRGARPR